ncbi:MAG: hypothetical protein HYY06_05695 [Deltaproteobacteria bacterium]|nr:hypothetical protein [Deltaproteobacteria bacterium]
MERQRFSWVLFLAAAIAGCGDDDGGEGEGEGEGEGLVILDITVNAAQGVLSDVQSVAGFFLSPGVTNCQGLATRRVQADDFANTHDPEYETWDQLAAPHVTTEVTEGSYMVLVEAYTTDTPVGEDCTANDECPDNRCIFDACVPKPKASGCDTDVYAFGERTNEAIEVRIYP